MASLSLVIPVYNVSGVLEPCLNALRAQTLAPDEIIAVDDGSGLSAANLVAPMAFAQLLRYIRSHHGWETFRPGLPQAGNTGSLRNRFRGTLLEGAVEAKTGSIARVNTLSGFFTVDGKTYTFSVMANHHVAGGRRAIAQIDSVVVAMARAVKRGR